jgi:CubicO group peptidase (beta-lactamase class C family)
LTAPTAAATLYSTAHDYGKFLADVLADERLLALFTQSPVPVEPRLHLSWGHGWGIEGTGPNAYLWQWGNNPGYRSFVMASPRTGAGFVLLTNSESGLVACNVEMGGEDRARRGAMQGAKHSDAPRHREHLQRRSALRIARAATSDFSVTGH